MNKLLTNNSEKTKELNIILNIARNNGYDIKMGLNLNNKIIDNKTNY